MQQRSLLVGILLTALILSLAVNGVLLLQLRTPAVAAETEPRIVVVTPTPDPAATLPPPQLLARAVSAAPRPTEPPAVLLALNARSAQVAPMPLDQLERGPAEPTPAPAATATTQPAPAAATVTTRPPAPTTVWQPTATAVWQPTPTVQPAVWQPTATAQPTPRPWPTAAQPAAAPTTAAVAAPLPDGRNVVGNGAPQSCTAAALATAVALGGRVSFNCGPNPVVIPISEQIQLTRSVEIDGGNLITLDGQNRTGILRSVNHLTIGLRNIALINGRTPDQGGALQLGYWSRLTVVNSRFLNNTALKNNAACDGGGALFIGGGSVAQIEGSRFEGNRANNGGAINNLRSGITILNSAFYDNHAQHSDAINQFGDCGGGGAVYIDATRKPVDGGPDPIILRGNVYVGNTTNNHGGAVFVAVHAGEKVEISYSTFENNRVTYTRSMPTSGTGGAIWYGKAISQAVDNYLTVSHSTFANNHADTQGGGLWTSLPARVANSTFVGNTAVNPTPLDRDDWRQGNGGGIAVAHQVLVIIENSTLVGNRAGFNGGAVVGENIAARNSIFANNSADWWRGLQQNCTHALQNWGNNLQYLVALAGSEHSHQSNCGRTVTVLDPRLGALTYLGGATRVLPLLKDSPAVDAGNPATCLPTDQRGVARPQGAACDIGAFELEQ